jgi:fused signal recognition particle receptor
MAFNWFKRQQGESAAESGESATESASPPEAQPEAPKADQATASEDYLNWAKTAYQNIQKRQQTEPLAEPTAEPSVETSASELSELADSVEVASASRKIEAPTVEIEVAEPTIAAEVTDDATESNLAESSADLPTIAPKSQFVLPFWAQAEAERQQRLEQLKATALEAMEPDVALAAATTEAPQTPDLPLDESFLWSAEVLASQGRRPDQISLEEITWLKRLRQGLDKTRRSLVNQLRAIVGQGPLNQDAVMEIESLLLQADVGVEATDYIIDALQKKLRDETLPPTEAIAYLKTLLREMLDNPLGKPISPTFAPEKDMLNIWLITGVNGAGKTTTIGKIAHIAQKSGYRTLIGAADTFRAAAVQQVKVWGDRSNVEVIANPGKNTDPAAVVFDAIVAAQSRNTELLLVDTAGRLQNKKNLMDELSKIRRIIDKKAPHAQIESLLVLDATLGQNGLRQAEVFSAAAQLTGVVLTKLDGTARGGIALAVVQQLGLPIRFIGAGEGIEDLRPFSSYEFIEALLSG